MKNLNPNRVRLEGIYCFHDKRPLYNLSNDECRVSTTCQIFFNVISGF